jgi:polar amino acid transport system substrate-binding protein
MAGVAGRPQAMNMAHMAAIRSMAAEVGLLALPLAPDLAISYTMRSLRLILVALVLIVTACTSRTASMPDETASGGFTTIQPGVLTVGTELPAPPFWLGDDYQHITGGFEADLAKAIANRLGITQVRFVEMPFSALVAGAACPCDIDLSQVTMNDERAKVVDFSAPYFDANQGILVTKGTKVADLVTARRLRWGAQLNTTGASYVTGALKPDKPLQVYSTTLDAFAALRAGQIDAVMLDVPIVAGEAGRAGSTFAVAGQVKTGERYGAVLAKGSANTPVVSKIIEELRNEGFLDQLQKRYFPTAADVPVLR